MKGLKLYKQKFGRLDKVFLSTVSAGLLFTTLLYLIPNVEEYACLCLLLFRPLLHGERRSEHGVLQKQCEEESRADLQARWTYY